MEKLQRSLEMGYARADKAAALASLTKDDMSGRLSSNGVGQILCRRIADDIVADPSYYFKSGSKTEVAVGIIRSALSLQTIGSMVAKAIVDAACEGTSRQHMSYELALDFIDVIIVEMVRKDHGLAAFGFLEDSISLVEKAYASYRVAEKIRDSVAFYRDRFGIDIDQHLMGFISLSQKLCLKAAERSGLFTHVPVGSKRGSRIPGHPFHTHRRGTLALGFTESAQAEIDGLKDLIADRVAKFRPMVCRPLPWRGMFGGGYLTQHYQRRSMLVKGRMSFRDRVEYGQRLDSDSIFLKALTAIQDTPFVVNQDVLALATSIYDGNRAIMGVPSRSAAKGRKTKSLAAAAQANRVEAGRRSKLLSVEATLRTAAEFSGYSQIFMPYNLDFRGRAYCLVSTLNPQGTDLQKAMLLFATPVKLGSSGHKWLKIHAANCYGHGLDKDSKQARIAWVDRNTKLIKMVANGSIHSRRFLELMRDKDRAPEDPMLFYAVCRELVQLYGKSDAEIAAFESRIPVSVDGSNNGLQHYAALLRNTTLAEKVNLHRLSEDDSPADVYRDVAQGMVQYLKRGKLACAKDLSVRLGVDEKVVRKAIRVIVKLDDALLRKLVKRPTMTQPYSVTSYGMSEQIKDVVDDLFTADKGSAAGRILVSEDVFDILAVVVFHGFLVGLETHCSAAKVGMDFLKSVAARKGDTLTWTTPSGFLARQRYNTVEYQTVKSRVGFRSLSVRYGVITDSLDDRKQISAVAPNFVHSMDASHMMLTIDSLLGNPGFVPNFFMIHDSFGTSAGQLGELDEAIRAEFVRMYSDNQFQRFIDQVDLGDDAGSVEIPAFGDFDIDDVNQATYFFA